MNEREIEFAELRVNQERDSAVQEASAAVSAPGSATCEDCGCGISPARRKAAPFAKRCFECQSAHEKEMRRYA
ncbi:MAG: molecular chaperone DnaK [Rhodobacterales bacterium]|nr:MAG: molecular chaperone DnaK [Rhodobacterales bacterium]